MLFGVGGFAIDQDGTRGRFDQFYEQVKKCGLAATGRADNTDKLSLLDVKGSVVQNQKIAKFFVRFRTETLISSLIGLPPYQAGCF